MKAAGEAMDMDYEEVKEHYNHYCDHKTTKNDYIDTKYYQPKESVKHREECFLIDAFAGDTIWVPCDNLVNHTKTEIAFLLLHEFAHIYLKTNNEHKCDLFARRWVKKLIKEGLLESN